jgi:hypothetical protein
MFSFEATDENEKILAQTKEVAPTSTEMGCKNCYGGNY